MAKIWFLIIQVYLLSRQWRFVGGRWSTVAYPCSRQISWTQKTALPGHRQHLSARLTGLRFQNLRNHPWSMLSPDLSDTEDCSPRARTASFFPSDWSEVSEVAESLSTRFPGVALPTCWAGLWRDCNTCSKSFLISSVLRWAKRRGSRDGAFSIAKRKRTTTDLSWWTRIF